MKLKTSRWIIYVIVIVVALSLFSVFSMLETKSGKKGQFGLIYSILTFVWIGFFVALVVYVLKAIKDKAEKRHKDIRVSQIISGGFFQSDDNMRWGAVVFYFYIIPPLGLFFLVKKVVDEKLKYYENGLRMIIIGATLLVFTGPITIAFLIAAIKGTSVLPLLVIGIYTVVGLACVVVGIIIKKEGVREGKYLKALLVDKVTSIDKIVNELGYSYAKVTENVQHLIDTGLLANAYIYHRDREIIIPGISKKIACRCKNCGGTTVLYKNEERKCVYCGARI